MYNSKIFQKRVEFKPFEYPEVIQLMDLINQTFWVHNEVTFTADVNDYNVNLTDAERTVFRRSMLGISQIEVGVKLFWGKLYEMFPKPELNAVGATFAHNEVIHSMAYSELLTVNGLEGEFDKLMEVPVIKKKQEFIDNKLSSKDVIDKLFFFTIGIENTSLFSLFANVFAFKRFKGYMKNTANIVEWSSRDENVHAQAGIYLINKVFEENPEIREKYTQDNIVKLMYKYIKVEQELLDWVYEDGELEFFTKTDMINFMKWRLDDALVKMGFDKVFNVSMTEYKPMQWFEEELAVDALQDFFASRPVDYTKHEAGFTSDDLF